MIRTFFERAFSVVLVLLACQFPLFIQQYEMRLSGHVVELRRFVASLEKSAQDSRKSLPEYIRKFVGHKDRDIANQGKLLEGVVERYKSFESSHQAIASSNMWTRPFVFIRYMNGEVAGETLIAFHPGLAMNLESLLYGFMGLLLATLLLSFRRQEKQSQK